MEMEKDKRGGDACVAVGCKTNYATCTEKVAVFTFPKEEVGNIREPRRWFGSQKSVRVVRETLRESIRKQRRAAHASETEVATDPHHSH